MLEGPGGSREAVTDAQGRFRFPEMAPGEYRLDASLEGFQTITTDVQVSPGSASRALLVLGLVGPVSPAEPLGGDGDGGTGGPTDEDSEPQDSGEQPGTGVESVAVVEKRFEDDLSVQSFLNSERSNGREVHAVIPVEPGVSLFVSMQPERLEARIRHHPDKVFVVGVHRLPSGASALVSRDVR